MMKLVCTKVSKFKDISPCPSHFLVPYDLKGDKLYWVLKDVLFKYFGIVTVEIDHTVDFDNKAELKTYCFNITGYNDLRGMIGNHYDDFKIPSISKKDHVKKTEEKEVIEEKVENSQLSFL